MAQTNKAILSGVSSSPTPLGRAPTLSSKSHKVETSQMTNSILKSLNGLTLLVRGCSALRCATRTIQTRHSFASTFTMKLVAHTTRLLTTVLLTGRSKCATPRTWPLLGSLPLMANSLRGSNQRTHRSPHHTHQHFLRHLTVYNMNQHSCSQPLPRTPSSPRALLRPVRRLAIQVHQALHVPVLVPTPQTLQVVQWISFQSPHFLS